MVMLKYMPYALSIAMWGGSTYIIQGVPKQIDTP